MKNEFEIKQLEKFARIRQHDGVVLGPCDDAAVLECFDNKNEQMVFCGDMLIEDVHFIKNNTTPYQIGHKAVARTLSDIAAMGAVPSYLGFSLALPLHDRNIIDGILDGARTLLDRFSCSLVGGDLSASDRICCDTWCIGRVKRDLFIRRSTASAGECIFVSGNLGGSYRSGRHLDFIPKIQQAGFLVANYSIGAMIDISDGFVFDLYRVLRQSRVGAVIYADSVPVNSDSVLHGALYDGEDYELLFTAPAALRTSLEENGFFFVGDIIEGEPEVVLDEKGSRRSLEVDGFSSLSKG